MISVIIPTIEGRSEHLTRCLNSYRTRSRHKLQIIIVRDRPTVGIAWNAGLEQATAPFVHCTNDDCEVLKGWDVAAVKVCRAGAIPAPGLIMRPDGGVDRELADGQIVTGNDADIDTIPFCTREQIDAIGPFLETHYFGDSFFTYRARQLGIPILGCADYAFIHHWASVGRGAGMDPMDRMRVDKAAFDAAVAR